MAAELLRTELRAPWSYSVTRDGRIFFINDESKSTTWLHPEYNHPIQSGNLSRQDLPNGWELAFTSEGVPYYVDHINLRTSFIHPVTGESTQPVHEDASPRSPGTSSNQNKNFKRSSLRRSSKKQKIIEKAPTPRRSSNAPVTLRGWLHKQDSGGLRGWKKRWFVLSDFCLYYYKGPEETQTQGAILLPSYSISFCNRDDGVNRKYSFKAEHQNMRSYYFAADSSDEQSQWMKALDLATVLKRDPSVEYIENTTPSGRYNQSTGPWSNQNRSSYPSDPGYNPDDLQHIQGDDDQQTYPEDTGGFGETRAHPSTLNQLSPGQNDQLLRSSVDEDGGFGDVQRARQRNSDIFPDSERSPRDTSSLSPNNSDIMYGQRGYDPQMRTGQGGEPAMRNTYITREPTYPDPRPNQYPDRWGNAQYPDDRGNTQQNYRDSMSSQGSRTVPRRDYNYNVPKTDPTAHDLMQGYNPQANGYNPTQYNPIRDSMTLEQSTDSLEKTLDRSFDSSQPLPGYDSFRKNQDERPLQYYHGDQPGSHGEQPDSHGEQHSNQGNQHNRPQMSRESSVVEVQRQNSLLRLQEWTKNQRNKMADRPSSAYSNASDRPISDGRRYGQERPTPSEQLSMHSHQEGPPPRSNNQQTQQGHSPPGTTQRSPPTGLKLDLSPTQDSSGRDNPGRPPIPAAYREQYIRELADTKTPHTRNDLLSSIQIQRMRQHEPLIFRYPEVSPPSVQGIAQPCFQGPSQPHKQAPIPPLLGGPILTQSSDKSLGEAEKPTTSSTQGVLQQYPKLTGSSGPGLSEQPPARKLTKALGGESVKPHGSSELPLVQDTSQHSQDQDRLGRKELSNEDELQKPQHSLDPSKSWDDLNELDEDLQETLNVNNRIDQLLAEKRCIVGGNEGQGHSHGDLSYGTHGGYSSFKPGKNKVASQDYEQYDSRGFVDDPYEKIEVDDKRIISPDYGAGITAKVPCPNQSVEQPSRDDNYGYEIPISQKDHLSSLNLLPPSRHVASPDSNKPVRRSLEPTFQCPLDNTYENADSLGHGTHNLYAKDIPHSQSRSNKMISEPSGGKYWSRVERTRADIQQHFSDGNHGNPPSYVAHEHGSNKHLGNQRNTIDGHPEQAVRDHFYHHGNQPPQVSQSQRDVRHSTMPPTGQYASMNHELNQSEQSERLSQSLGNLHVDVGGWPDNAQATVKQSAPRLPWQQPEPLLDRMSSSTGNLQVEEGSDSFGQGPCQDQSASFTKRDIDTIKEDPNMSDQDIFSTKTLADLQRHLSGHRLRLSISANDLMGKSHEELVLLLIQLRRDQARLERIRDYYRSKLDINRPQEKDYKLKRKNSIGRLHEVVEKEHDQYLEVRKMYDELEKQLEVTKPLVNLLDNMVRMGSLYGGDNLMLASQYKQHKLHPDEYTPPKKMITFSRQYQEDKLSKLQDAELKQLMEDEVDLEEKLQQLYKLDRELQEKSIDVTNLQENKDLLENSVIQRRKDIQMTEEPHKLQNMKHQLRHLEGELAIVRQQLAESSRALEETSAEDAMVENEVMLLRKKIYGLNRTHSTPSLSNETIRTRQKLEQELKGVQSVMDGLSRQGAVLSDTIKALRHSTPDLTAADNKSQGDKTYMETDLDDGSSRDLGKERFLSEREPRYSTSPYKRREESQYASIRKDRPRNVGRDRSRSEPAEVDESWHRGDSWYSSMDNTDVKVPFESSDRHAPSEYASIKHESGHRYVEDSIQKSSVQVMRGAQQNVYTGSSLYQSPRVPDKQERKDGLYHAEMRMVTPEPSDHHRYQPNQDSASSQDNSSRDELLGQSHLHGNQVRVDVDKEVDVSGVEGNVSKDRVSDYVRSLNTPEAEEQRSFDILHEARFSLNSDTIYGMKDQLDERSIQGERSTQGDVLIQGSGSSRDMHVVSDTSTNTKHQVVISSRTHTKTINTQGNNQQNAHMGAPHAQEHRHQTSNTEKHNSEYTKVVKHQEVHQDEHVVQERHSLRGSTSNVRHSVEGSNSHSPRYSAENKLALKQQQRLGKSPKVDRMDSHAKRLTSDLAISLLAGKEEVIRTALKRVSSDGSDVSDIKVQLRKKQNKMKPLEEYIASLNTTDGIPAASQPRYSTSPHSISPNGLGTSPTIHDRPSPPARDSSSIGLRHLTGPNLSYQSTSQPLKTSTSGASCLSRSTSGSTSFSSSQSPNSPLAALHTDPSTQTNPSHEGQHVAPKLTTTTNQQSMITKNSQSQTTILQKQDRRMYDQQISAYNYPVTRKPMSEVHPQQQGYVERVEEPVLTQQSSFPDYEPIELSQADDNTKKFFGLFSKDVSKSQTVREVKKEAERRSRERKRFYVNVHGDPEDIEEAEAMTRDFHRSRSLPRKTSAPMSYSAPPMSHDDSSLPRRKSVGVHKNKQEDKSDRRVSAADRLFPQEPGHTSSHPNSRESVRRISDIFSPRPFTAGASWQKDKETTLNVNGQISGATIATVRPVVNKRDQQQAETVQINPRTFEVVNHYGSTNSKALSSEKMHSVCEDDQVKAYWKDRKRNRHIPRGRYMTISGAQPAQMEQTSGRWRPSKHQSAAGDLIVGHWHEDIPNYIQSEPLKDFKIDDQTIDREVLFVPEKVDIPERYIPDSDEEETVDDREHRIAKSNQIKRMLAAQSLAEWKQEEVGLKPNSGPIHAQVEAERKRREHLLDLKQALAIQVTQRSKQVAGSNKPCRPPYPEFMTDLKLTPAQDTYTSHTTLGPLSPTLLANKGRRIRTLSK